MPRPPRHSLAGMVYHVLNRANAGATVFGTEQDYQDFLGLLAEAGERRPVALYGWCLLPDHFHLVVQPAADGDLSRWMQWLATAHVRRWHQRHHTAGHLWQGRYRSFPVAPGEPLLAVLRYVEHHPVRAGLAGAPADWPWSSRSPNLPPTLAARRAEPPNGWDLDPLPGEVAAVRLALSRSRPFGPPDWQAEVARQLGLECSLHPRGRPRKGPEA